VSQRDGSSGIELAPLEISSRVPRLRQQLGAAGSEAILVSKIDNVHYLTGFTGSAGLVYVDADRLVAMTDGRYRDQITEELAAADVQADIVVGRLGEQRDALRKLVSSSTRLALEASNVSWAERNELARLLPGVTLVPTEGVVEALRRVKDPGELARIERAAEIADIALAQVKTRLAQEISERDFAAELEFEMRMRGADGPSFDTIVASGPNAALPHARPSARRIVENELVVIDFGALVDGYHSDMTRTLCAGTPSRQLADAADAVLAAQRAGVRTVRAGVPACDVDAACRGVLEEADLGHAFVHPTGHGVGLEIHEAPLLAAGVTEALRLGAAVTVEPGAYLPGIGGIRIEDTVVVEDQGARALTRSTKDITL
jgi:Xaa-Pro aminopeptidase